MRVQLAVAIIFSVYAVNVAQAASPMEREMANKTLHFGMPSASPVYAAPTADETAQPEKKPAPSCGGSWYNPIVQAMGSVVGGLAGSYVGGGGGQHAATIVGGAVGGVATNEALKAACDQQAQQ